MDYSHTPVMWNEVRGFMEASLGSGESIAVDCTCGEGGHSVLLLETFPGLRVIAFERDEEILAIARERLSRFGDRVEFINDNFSSFGSRLEGRGERIMGVLYDFGISSFHLDKSGRGFSLRDEQPLDMRLDMSCGKSARDIVNKSTEIQLTEIIKEYGEERWARRIARYICRSREKAPIETTRELAILVLKAIPSRYHVKNIHPATRVFQALRIAVNDELSAIDDSLRDAVRIIASGGRLCALSFHSLEDRIVKTVFRRAARGCLCREERCLCEGGPVMKILTKKPLEPGEAELVNNRRARSAKLRAAEKI